MTLLNGLKLRSLFFLFTSVIFLAGCSTVQGRYSFLNNTYPSLPANTSIEVFKDALPAKPFIRIARLDAHFERTVFIPTSYDEAIIELKKQARLAGAQGIIEIEETRSSVMETKIYHLTATGIRFAKTGISDN